MTPAPPTKTVALVDHLWIGHHPMYFSQVTAAFLRAGAFVIGLCPEPGEAFIAARSAIRLPDFETRVSTHRLPGGKRSWFRGRFEGDPLLTDQRRKDSVKDPEVKIMKPTQGRDGVWQFEYDISLEEA